MDYTFNRKERRGGSREDQGSGKMDVRRAGLELGPSVRTLFLCGTLLAAVGSAPAAWAGNDKASTQVAKGHYDKGVKLYQQARYLEAISEFEAAYRAKPLGVLYFNIAQCYEKLEDIPWALRSYHEYLRAVPNAEDRTAVEYSMRNLEARLAVKGLQQVLVYTTPAGATVKVDGQPRGVSPFSAEIPIGAHRITVAQQGFLTKNKEVHLTAERSVVVEFTMERGVDPPVVAVAPPPPAPPPPPPAPPPGEPAIRLAPITIEPSTPPPSDKPTAAPKLGQPAPAPKPIVIERTEPEAKKSGRLWTWVAAGTSGAALVTGLGFGVAAKAAELQLAAAEHDRLYATRLEAAAQARATGANVCFAVAAATGVAAIVLFFVEGG